MTMEEDLKEYKNNHIELIKKLSSLSNDQLVAFINKLYQPEMFSILKAVTELENKILSEFMNEYEKPDEKTKNEPTKIPSQKELRRASEDMFEPSQYDRVQIGGEKK